MAQKAQVNPVLAYYLASLTSKPLLTKSLTGLVVSYASEITAARLSGTAPVVHKNTGLPPIDFVLSNDKALKLAAYGALISAPMGHTLREFSTMIVWLETR